MISSHLPQNIMTLSAAYLHCHMEMCNYQLRQILNFGEPTNVKSQTGSKGHKQIQVISSAPTWT